MKTPKVIGLLAAMTTLALVPAAAISQGKKAAEIPAAARKAGMEKAPALVQAAGIGCQVSDARLLGEDKKSKTSYYEVACGPGNLGFVLQAPAEGTPTAFTCVEANTPPAPDKPASAPCILPGNANPQAALAPLLQKAGVACVPEKARGIGQTKTQTYLEVACQGGQGYIIAASSPFDAGKPAQAQNCLLYDEAQTNIKCALTERATRLAVVDRFAQESGTNCAVKDRRFVGAAKDGSQYFEASCNDGKGYIFKANAGGAFQQAMECAKATAIMGGCELTDARQALTEQAALYTRLAKQGGSNCDVERYALFPSQPGTEVVELACKGGAGAVGIFKAGSNQVVDCGRAPVAGYRCSLTKPESAYSYLTADLKSFNYNSCEVSNTRVVGKTAKGTTFVEVACADGLKGYVIEYQSQPTVKAIQATGCAFAGTCALPGNK